MIMIIIILFFLTVTLFSEFFEYVKTQHLFEIYCFVTIKKIFKCVCVYIYIYTEQNYKCNTFIFAPIFHELNSKI